MYRFLFCFIFCFLFFFFFSSRRRHTRSLRDWSSDVCSSDLTNIGIGPVVGCRGAVCCAPTRQDGCDSRSFLVLNVLLSAFARSEEHTSELQSRRDLVCRLLLEKKKANLGSF